MIVKSVFITLAILMAIVLVTRWAIVRYTPEAKSLYQDGVLLSICPDSPNCVSSTFSDDSHHIAALAGDSQTFSALKSLVASEDRVRVISETEHYLHAEFRTKLLAYVDDLELLHINGSGVIQIRSASRLGKSDFGINRKRLQTLIKKLKL